MFFFFSSRRRHTRFDCDWSSDVCSSDLIAEDLVATHAEAEVASEEWDWKALDDAVFAQFNFRLQFPESEREGLRMEGLQDILVERVKQAYAQREQLFGAPIVRHL